MVRSGRGFDGGPGQDFADFLRRELHAAADQVEPGSDGLERIRDKIRSRPARASQPKWILGVWLGVWGVAVRLIRRLSNPAGGAGRSQNRGDVSRSGPGTGARPCSGRPSPSARPCSRSAWSCRSFRPRARR